jgi:hypothetical protein
MQNSQSEEGNEEIDITPLAPLTKTPYLARNKQEHLVILTFIRRISYDEIDTLLDFFTFLSNILRQTKDS